MAGERLHGVGGQIQRKSSESGMDGFLEAQDSSTFPEFVFGDSLREAPYVVSVDREKAARLLIDGGLSEDEIGDVEIFIERRPKSKVVLKSLVSVKEVGIYDFLEQSITLHTDPFWERYEKYLQLAQKITEGKKKPRKNQFQGLLYTKKLSEYLAIAPPERGLPFANQLLLNGTQRMINSTFHHELKHLMDDYQTNLLRVSISLRSVFIVSFSGLLAFDFYSGGLRPTGMVPLDATIDVVLGYLTTRRILYPAVQLAFLDSLDPVERSARKFAKSLENNPKWRSIITISPKNSKI